MTMTVGAPTSTDTVYHQDMAAQWVDAIIDPHNEVLSLTRAAEIVVALLSVVSCLMVHASMVFYSVKKKARREEAPYSRGKEATVYCLGAMVHLQVGAFYMLPLVTMLFYSPLLWILEIWLVLGVVFHHVSLVSIFKSSSKNI